jgi:N-acetylneuraminate lyase
MIMVLPPAALPRAFFVAARPRVLVGFHQPTNLEVSMPRPRFKELVAAVPTPMNPDGSVNLEAVGPMCELLVADGVSGLFACGSTGEGHSLTTAERKAVAGAFADALAGRLPLIVHVGHNALRDAQDLAAHAQSIGAAAVAACPPSYFLPGDPEAVVSCCAEIAAAAPELPFYYYHIPQRTNVNVRVIDILNVAAEELPALAGVKFTHENLMDLRQCITFADGRFNCLFGRDEMLLSGLATGAEGAVGTTYSFAAPLYRRLWQAFALGDLEEARRCQDLAIEVIMLLFRFGGLGCTKVVMKLIGVDCGPTRQPVRTCTLEEEKQIETSLRRMGFFDWGRHA